MIYNIYQSLHKIFCRVFSRIMLIIELVYKKPSTHTCYKHYPCMQPVITIANKE